MRILMLTDFYRPFTGGVELHVEHLSRSLVERGHEVTVATHHIQGEERVETISGVHVHRFDSLSGRSRRLHSNCHRPWAPPAPDPGLVRQLNSLIADVQPDIVHGHDWFERSYLPLKRKTGPAFVTTLHYYTLSCAKKNLLFKDGICSGPALSKCAGCAGAHYGTVKGPLVYAANRVFARLERRLTDATIAVSRATAAGNGIDADDPSCFVVPNFLTPASNSDDDAAQFVAQLPNSPFLLFAGDLRSAKGIDVLFAAYKLLSNPPPVVLIGSAGDSALEALPPGVSIHGEWPNVAVRAAWRRCLFGVVPSVWSEPFGIVLLECMEAGRPVIASRIGGIPDVVDDGITGDMVTPGDPASLAAAIQRLVDDPSRRERMGIAAKKRSALFTAEAVVPRIESVYAYAIAQRTTRKAL